MSEGFKMFKVLPEGAGSALAKAAKVQVEAERKAAEERRKRPALLKRGGLTDAQERDVLSKIMDDEIQVRLKTDPRFRLAWYGSKQTAAGVIAQVVQDKEERLKAMGKVNSAGVRIIKGSLPAEWKSEEVIS